MPTVSQGSYCFRLEHSFPYPGTILLLTSQFLLETFSVLFHCHTQSHLQRTDFEIQIPALPLTKSIMDFVEDGRAWNPMSQFFPLSPGPPPHWSSILVTTVTDCRQVTESQLLHPEKGAEHNIYFIMLRGLIW